jgi:hypothetical protein
MIMNANDLFKAVMQLDLEPIKTKLMHVQSGEGWSQDKADAVEKEYRRFLCLMKMYPDEDTAPLVDVDTFWHYHILDTMKYAVDCQAVFGYFLHHYPYVGMRGDDDEQFRLDSGDRMRELYEATFGEAYPGSDSDSLEDGHTSTDAMATAFCAGPRIQPQTAFCAGPRVEAQTAFCAGPRDKTIEANGSENASGTATAFCAGPRVQAQTAFCAGPRVQARTAFCAGPRVKAQTAFCAGPRDKTIAAKRSENASGAATAFCAGPRVQAQTAFCAGPRVQAQTAFCAGPRIQAQTAFCAGPRKTHGTQEAAR